MLALSHALWGWAAFLLAAGVAMAWASWRHFRPVPPLPPGPRGASFSLIKPLRGADEHMLDDFRAMFAADTDGLMQVIFAVESEDDPACAVARRAVADHPGRDAEVALTGPSGPRSGKAHNMIEGFKRARHPFVVFSDADIRTTPEMVVQTARAFAEGAEAVFGLPRHRRSETVGGVWFMIGFNHFFLAPAALTYRLGFYRSFAGAWMGYSRRLVDSIGGLEFLSERIADDYSLGARAIQEGPRLAVLREFVEVDETGKGLGETYRHLAKWCMMGRWTLPAVFMLIPLACPGFVAGLAWAAGRAAGTELPGEALWAGVLAWRAAAGWAVDRWVLKTPLPWWGYGFLALSDLGILLFWLGGFRRTLDWRGKRYRLHPGGRAEVVAA